MRIGGLLLPFAGVLIATACSSFNGAATSGSPDDAGTGSDGDSDGGSIQGTPGPTGELGLKASLSSARITQGGATVTIDVSIAANSTNHVVTVTAAQLPSGVTANTVLLGGTTITGQLVLTASATATQGDAKVAITAIDADGRTDGAALDLFVRGTTGEIDTTFGTNGSFDLGDTTASAVRTSKSMVIAAPAVGVRRFLRDGSLDATFTPIPAGPLAVLAVAPDASVYVKGAGTQGILHYESNGSLDNDFRPTNPGNDFASYLIGAGPAGNTVIAGNLYLSEANNRLDSAIVNTEGGLGTEQQYTCATDSFEPAYIDLQSDGSFLLAVFTGQPFVRLARLNANATVDTTFFGGKVVSDIAINGSGPFAGPSDFQSSSDGVYMYADVAGATGINLVRFKPTGEVDTAFGGGTGIPGITQPAALGSMITSDNPGSFDFDSQRRPIVASITDVAGAQVLAVSRFNLDGTADTTFAPSGYFTVSLGATPKIVKAMIADDERLVLVSTHDGEAFMTRIWL